MYGRILKTPLYRNSHQSCSIMKGAPRNFANFTGNHLCQSLFLNKVAVQRSTTLLKKRLWHRCFPLNFAKFLWTLFLQNSSGRLLLCIYIYNSESLLYENLFFSRKLTTRAWFFKTCSAECPWTSGLVIWILWRMSLDVWSCDMNTLENVLGRLVLWYEYSAECPWTSGLVIQILCKMSLDVWSCDMNTLQNVLGRPVLWYE